MSSKRSAGSILEYFTKKPKNQTSSLSTEQIASIDFTDLSTSSQVENSELSPAAQASSHSHTSSLSNLNDLSENYYESENQSRFLDTSDKSSNTDNILPTSQPINSSFSRSPVQNIPLISKCDSQCCNSSTPYHPVREDELISNTIDKRSCQKRWFNDYPWLTFCKVQKKVFCYTCRVAFERKIHPNTTKLHPTHRSFIFDGCCDWKNSLSRFKLHETSQLHRDSIYVVTQQQKPTITTQLISTTKKQQEQRRQALSIQISSIMYLLRQGLALRGHSDEDSNLIQLLKLRSIDNSFLKEWIHDKKYSSHDIVNEICKEIYLTIVRDIVKEISNRKWFSLICDETCDESTREQLCITLRSVDNNYQVFEDVIGLYEISRQNAPTVVEAILDALTRCGLDMGDCRGQSFDGASNMSGLYGGVSALILKQQSKAIYVHCNAHCLDLAIQDLTNGCITIRNCMSFVKEIIDFIRRSPKRLNILKETSTEMSMPYTHLTPLCPTRWTMRAGSYSSLLQNYELVQETLFSISEEKSVPGVKANGLYEQMNRFNFFFGLKLSCSVFMDTEKLSRVLQRSNCCLQDVLVAAETVTGAAERVGWVRLEPHPNWALLGSASPEFGL